MKSLKIIIPNAKNINNEHYYFLDKKYFKKRYILKNKHHKLDFHTKTDLVVAIQSHILNTEFIIKSFLSKSPLYVSSYRINTLKDYQAFNSYIKYNLFNYVKIYLYGLTIYWDKCMHISGDVNKFMEMINGIRYFRYLTLKMFTLEQIVKRFFEYILTRPNYQLNIKFKFDLDSI